MRVLGQKKLQGGGAPNAPLPACLGLSQRPAPSSGLSKCMLCDTFLFKQLTALLKFVYIPFKNDKFILGLIYTFPI